MDTDISHEVEKRLDALDERVTALEGGPGGPKDRVDEEEEEEGE